MAKLRYLADGPVTITKPTNVEGTPTSVPDFNQKTLGQTPVISTSKQEFKLNLGSSNEGDISINFNAADGITAIVIGGSVYEIRDQVAKEAVELSKSPEFEEDVKSSGVTRNDIMLFLGMKRAEEEKEKVTASLEKVLEHKEKAEESEVRGHESFVKEKVTKETGAKEEERMRVTEEILDKAINNVVGRRLRPEEEIVDRTTEIREEMNESGVRQTVEIIRESRGGEVKERRRIVSKAEESAEKVRQSEGCLKEMDRISSMAGDKGTSADKIYKELQVAAERAANPEIEVLIGKIGKPGIDEKERIRIVAAEANKNLEQLELVKKVLSEVEKARMQKLGRESVIAETRKKVENERAKMEKKGKTYEDLLKELKNLTGMGAQELQKKKDELLKGIPEVQKEIAGKLLEDTSNILKKKISDSRKDDEKIRKLESERERIKPEELRKRLLDLLKDDKKSLEELQKLKDNEISEYAKKKLQARIEEGQAKRKNFDDVIKELQKSAISTLKEIDDRLKERVKDPELLKEIEEKQIEGIVGHIEKKMKNLKQAEESLKAVSQKMEEFSKKIDNAKQGIVDVFRKFSKKQVVPEDAEAIKKINELKGLEGIEFAKLHSKQETEKLKENAEFWMKKYKELTKCIEDPVLIKQFSEKVKEIAQREPNFSKMLRTKPSDKEIVSRVKALSEEKEKRLGEWLKTYSEVDEISSGLYKQWDEVAGFIEGIKSPVKGMIQVPKEGIDWKTIEKISENSGKTIDSCRKESSFWENVLGQVKDLKEKPEEFNKKLEELLKGRPEDLYSIRKLSKDKAEQYMQDRIDESVKIPALENLKRFIDIYSNYDLDKLLAKLGYEKENTESLIKMYSAVLSAAEKASSSGPDKKGMISALRQISKDNPGRLKLKLARFAKRCICGGYGKEKIIKEIEKEFRAEKLVYEIVHKSGFSKALADKNYESVDTLAGKIADMADGMENLNEKIINIRASTEDEKERKKELAKAIAEIYKKIWKDKNGKKRD